ncbi:BglG family transcription antiterminator LicT [Clostridium intestinale]|uniref:Transcriptional antiterminator, BglG family n=1 Tax=Clostridium intestinale DSM 6191 TaxID=1121320 RepID=A0A1M5WMG3_9CLOT|nr:PRD domain-containing protein [Clostridium intestinale]SHH88750.1 transcriptional antiterminator, BglG family [Clostridium intestinale DSM 6191]
MYIKHILNNNAVVTLDTTGKEVIVKGKGIAFKKAVGDEIDESKIEKKFVLDNKETSRNYQEIIINIPSDCIEVSEEVIEAIKQNIDKKLSDKIYVTLTDHISNLLERISMGITFNNILLWDVKRMYKEEYKAGLKAVEIIRERFDIKVSDDEASFIALHIVNAEMNVEFEKVFDITAMIDRVYSIIEEEFNLEVDKDSLAYNRFIIHLKFFFERIVNKQSLEIDTSDNLLNMMRKEYPKQYDCVEKIVDYISSKYSEPIDGELIYLMLHVVKLTS